MRQHFDILTSTKRGKKIKAQVSSLLSSSTVAISSLKGLPRSQKQWVLITLEHFILQITTELPVCDAARCPDLAGCWGPALLVPMKTQRDICEAALRVALSSLRCERCGANAAEPLADGTLPFPVPTPNVRSYRSTFHKLLVTGCISLKRFPLSWM